MQPRLASCMLVAASPDPTKEGRWRPGKRRGPFQGLCQVCAAAGVGVEPQVVPVGKVSEAPHWDAIGRTIVRLGHVKFPGSNSS